MILSRLFKRFIKPKTREITLEELSVYWMDKPAQRTKPLNSVNPNSADKSEMNPLQKQEQAWKHAEINDFYTSYILPHTRILENAALSVIEEILTILDGPGGDCPSIVTGDEETPSPYHVLTSTLREHSLDITREAWDIIKKNNQSMLIGKIFIATLGHDLGKIPGKNGGNTIHAHKSAKILEPIIKNLQYKENISTAVQSHHLSDSELKQVKDNTVFILRQADWNSRKKELDRIPVPGTPTKTEAEPTADKIKPEGQQDMNMEVQQDVDMETPAKAEPMSWLNLHSFVQTVKPHINLDGTNSVFSLKDTMYVRSCWLKDVIAKEANERGDKETALRCNDSGDQKIIKLIAEKLKSKPLEYRVHFLDSKKPINIQCCAFKLELFGNPDEIKSRKRKSNVLKTIKSIK